LHIEGTVIHDACHKAAHPVPWINQAMGHGSAILLGFISLTLSPIQVLDKQG